MQEEEANSDRDSGDGETRNKEGEEKTNGAYQYTSQDSH